MRYDTDHKEKTRITLLKEAARAIRRDGPEKLSLSGVMKSAGLTNGGFYAHFKSRDDLLEAGIGQMFRESRARAYLEGEGTPADNLVSFLSFYLSRAHRDSRTAGCALAFLNSDAPRLPAGAGRKFAEGVSTLTGLLAKTLKAMDVAHADETASSLLSELVGAVGLARAEPDSAKSDLILKRSRRAIGRRFDLEIQER